MEDFTYPLYTYSWVDKEQTALQGVAEGVGCKYIFAEADDPDYQMYLLLLSEGKVQEAKPYTDPTVIDGITDLAQAKTVASDSVRSEAYSRLLPTDWVVTREMETGTPAPADTTAYRVAVRSAADEKVSVIQSKSKLSTLQTYLRSAEFAAWPEAPAS